MVANSGLTSGTKLSRATPRLVMDEAASNLDAENEQELQRAVHAARRGRTKLVIAH